MAYKCTFFFEGVQDANIYASSTVGWTETFYLSHPGLTSIDQALTDIDVNSYIALRRRFMASIYRIAWLRVSDEDNPRLYKIRALNNERGQAVVSPSAPPTPAAQVQCGVLVDFVRLPIGLGDITHHRRMIIRGMPTDIIDGNILNTGVATWPLLKGFLNWLAFQEAGGFVVAGPPNGFQENRGLGMRFHDPAVPYQTVTAAVADSSKLSIIVQPQIAPPVGFPKYEFRDFPAPFGKFNRIWTWQGNQAGPPATSTYGKSRSQLLSDAYAGIGSARFRRVAYLYGLFSEYTIIGLRSKKTGRLFRQLRGRQSNRKA